MKKINILKTSFLLGTSLLLLSACSSKNSTYGMNKSTMIQSMNSMEACNVQNRGIKEVINTASKLNIIAQKQDLEFMRLGMKNSQYISAVNEALKNDAKTIDIVNKKNKKTGTISIEYAAWRSCSFSIASLQQAHDAKTTWRQAVPGDGFSY